MFKTKKDNRPKDRLKVRLKDRSIKMEAESDKHLVIDNLPLDNQKRK